MRINGQQIFNPQKLRLSRLLSRLSGTYFPGKDINRPVRRESVKKILVLEHECIGDLIMLEPALRALKEHFSSAELHILCVPAAKDLALKAGLADRVLSGSTEKIRKTYYDMILDFHGDIRRIRMMKKIPAAYRCGFQFSGGAAWLTHVAEFPCRRHQVERPFVLLEKIGISAGSRSPRLKNFPGKPEDPRKILLHPGAAQKGRLWPAGHWERLMTILQKEKYDFAWINPPGEVSPEGVSEIKGDLTGIAMHMNNAALVLGCDSMAVHLAAALHTPALAIFGSQDPGLTRPYGKYGHVITPKKACTHKRRDWRLCPECMAAVTPGEVMRKIRAITELHGGAL